jgi:outer membrane protein OmpA-like peptidoglycan-associated protein
MAFNLLDSVRNYITPELITTASSHLGESSTGVAKGITAALPLLLVGLGNKAEGGGPSNILSEAKNMASGDFFGNLGNLFGGQTSNITTGGTSWLNNLFGSKTGTVVSGISNFAGIRNGSASSLLGMLAPLLLGLLGRHATENNLSQDGFDKLLIDQKNTAMEAIPSGLSLGTLFGGTGSAFAAREREMETAFETPKKRGSSAWPILLTVGGLALLGVFLSRGCNDEAKVASSTSNDTMTVQPVVPPEIKEPQPVRASLKVRLADNTEIDAYRGGIEDRLVTCLNDQACIPGKDKWFDFDNINFEMGSVMLTAESNAQIKNIVAILKAYPKVKIKIGGYTDRTGDAAANKKLSMDRATSVVAGLKAAGGNPGQIVGAEGYGSEFAKVDASATDEERRVDRRISVQLREK